VPSDRERAIAFLREHAREAAGRIVPLQFGFAILDDELPHVWDLNLLWVDDARGVDARTLAGAADRVLGGAGLRHRKAVVPDEVAGRRLAGGIEQLGWSCSRDVLMAHRRDPDRVETTRASEVGQEEMSSLRAAFMREDASEAALDEETQRQVLAAPARTPVRSFAVADDRRLVAGCDLFERGDVAQIESVVTLPSHRNRGLARAVVLQALDAARRGGAELVFLEAVEEDWPATLYAKLGFEPIGRLWLLTRMPPAPGQDTSSRSSSSAAELMQ
jgi:GNAT superfamily N-acetyltransferase